MIFRVPFICKFKPGIPGIPVREDDYDDHYDEDPYHEADLEEEEEMYGLKVQLLSEDDDEKRATLLETRSDSTTVFNISAVLMIWHFIFSLATGRCGGHNLCQQPH